VGRQEDSSWRIARSSCGKGELAAPCLRELGNGKKSTSSTDAQRDGPGSVGLDGGQVFEQPRAAMHLNTLRGRRGEGQIRD
jgi:hypothetical protein